MIRKPRLRSFRPRALTDLRRAARSGDLSVVGGSPAARAVVKAIVTDVAEQRAGSDTPKGKVLSPAAPIRDADYRRILDLLVMPVGVPVWDYDPARIEQRTIPSDREAQLSLFTLLHMYSLSATMNPSPPVIGSTASTGANVVLSHPVAADTNPMVVPGVLLEISQDNNTSQLAQVAATLTGWLYGGGTPDLDPNAATTADHYEATAATWATGTFAFAPLVRGKTRVLVTPYKVVNAKTFLSPIMLANIDTMASTALTLTLDTTSHPTGTLVEMTALGVDHDFFQRVYNRLVLELD